ncbi:DUF3986 family protein [Sutcliffiella horikoshii]|uniref:DUF3986 family protein n=1 Tax=Sutcliffiella horikoshii TaxID=79883 RepID=UPI00384B5919
MLFDNNYHLHAGYYKDGHDLEAIFLKVKNQNVWCMFFENDFYQLNLPQDPYPTLKNFGLLVGIYSLKTEHLTEQKASELLEEFLKEHKLI